jgi:thioredoxin-related protein
MKKLLLSLAFAFIITNSFAQSVLSTDSILTAAYKKASKEKKNVFVIFPGSWFGWCKNLDALLNDSTTKKYFDDNFVTVHLTVQETGKNKSLENLGAAELLAKYKGQEGGLPFFLILDKQGKLIGDSFLNNENTGCPANEKEVDYFISLLKKSSKINEEGLAIIKKRFRKNDVH